MKFRLKSKFVPTGDQPQAIDQLTKGVEDDQQHQVLLGVTGSGKTFTMANVIANTQKPTLVIAHNKTLAAQLYQEFRDFFPDNAVSYFVSYYDYYQPEAYIPSTDTYIEKEADINQEIEKLRLAATTNLLTRPDVIIVASVSCIYNLGSPVEYGKYVLQIMEGEVISRKTLLLQLANLQYERSTTDFKRGTYRLRGDVLQVWPAYQDQALKIDTLENRITSIEEIDPISGLPVDEKNKTQPRTKGPKTFVIYPAKHYMVNPRTQEAALREIEQDLHKSLERLKKENKILEAYRLKQKVTYDLDMIREFGFVNGIENYSRYFDNRKPGQPPFTLLDYFQANRTKFNLGSFLTIIDESHMTIPQIGGMYRGDQARKQTLIEYGFRLPSAIDNRPLQFEEFLQRNDQLIYVSATPREWEIDKSKHTIVEQLVRPTGLIDPLIELRPTKNQIEDLVIEVMARKANGQRVLVTTLTKKMAEALTEYLNNPEKIKKLVRSHTSRRKFEAEQSDPDQIIMAADQIPVDQMEIGSIANQYFSKNNIDRSHFSPSKLLLPKVAYLHSDINTLDRSDILDDLRRGKYDVLVGINLLREGLDLPEVSLVAILDADKEGFLRSSISLIQTMGRAARHLDGQAILYADNMTRSMKIAIQETQRRRITQVKYNRRHKIEPTSITKPIREKLLLREEGEDYLSKKGKTNHLTPIVISLSKKEKIDLTRIVASDLTPDDRQKLRLKLRKAMRRAALDLDYELAALIRDKVQELET